MQKELTPTEIASMSEVVAKYMGKWNEPQKYWFGKNSINFLDWNNIHSVWEKVSSEEVDGMNQYWYQIELAICGNDIQEAFWALHRAITFINKLKQ